MYRYGTIKIEGQEDRRFRLSGRDILRGQAGISVLLRVIVPLLCWFIAQTPALAQEKMLRWGADAEGGAPYIFKDPRNPKGNLGFEVDIIDRLSKILRRPIEFRQYDYKNLLLGLERRDFDFAMNGLEVTPARKNDARFSRPYYIYQL